MGMYHRHFHAELEDAPLKLDKHLFRRLLRYVAPYKGCIVGATLAMLAVSAVGLIQPLLLRRAVDVHIAGRDFRGLLGVSLLYLVSHLIVWVASYWQSFWMSWAGQSALYELRQDLFDHLQQLSVRFFDKRKVGELMSRVTNDIDVLAELLSSGIISVVNSLLVLVGIVVIMLILNYRLALVTFLSFPLMAFVAFNFRQRMRETFRLVRRKIGEVNANLQESITGVRVTKSFGQERRNIRRFQGVNAENMQANVQAIDLFAVFMPAVEVVGAIGTALVIWYGSRLVLADVVTLGTLIAFLSYASRFFQPIRELSQIYNQLQSAGAACERIFGILDVEPEIKDPPQPVHFQGLQKGITYDSVWFHYEPGEDVLKDINLFIPKGHTIALVGPTGAGKTTLASLLYRLYDPTSGRILLDDTDLRECSLASVRRRCGVVLQDTFLFTGTVYENIAYGAPGREVSHKEVEEVAKHLGIHPFIENLPDGYDTPVGERGSGLSLGQRQLVAFARALIRDPDILILDEATSSVDIQTEALLQQALEKLRAGRTTVIIAHRLSTVRSADQIVVLEEGRIVERGRHEELLAKDGAYSRLYEKQFADVSTQETADPVMKHTG